MTTTRKPLDTSTIDELTPEQCWEYLATTDMGRLAVRRDEGIDIFPINYLVDSGTLYFRSAPGTKLVDLTEHPHVAFEIDGDTGQTHWSVVVRGAAARLSLDTEIQASGVLALDTLTDTTKWNYVRIQPETVTGRRFTTAPPAEDIGAIAVGAELL